MGEKKTTPITIDDVQYVLEDMKPEQQAMVNHIADLDRKIGSTQFNLEQLQVGKQAFIDMLKKSLEIVEIKEAA
jgi:restriction endonuclease S subunit